MGEHRHEIMVTVDAGDRTAGLVRTNGQIRLAAAIRDGEPHGMVALDPEGITTLGLAARDGERVLVGGLLAEGVAAVAVRDACGDMVEASLAEGAWVAVVRGDDAIVVFRDADGHIVPQRLPDGLQPVEDAVTSCPGCGATTWGAVSGTVACLSCGHRERMGVFYGALADVEFPPEEMCDDEPDPVVEQFLARERRHELATAYALDASWTGPRRFHGGGTDRVTLGHGDPQRDYVTVTTTVPDDLGMGEDVLAQALSDAFEDRTPWPPRLSPPALSLWLEDRRREVAARVAAADRHVGVMTVDGTAHVATFAAEGDAWAAALEVDDVLVLVAARGVAPGVVRLARVDDPAPYMGSFSW